MSHAIANVVRLDQQLRAEFETITPEKAEQYLGKNTGNRSYKTAKIAAYARDIASGSFVVTGEAIKFDWTGRLIDGQNRLAAIISAGAPITTLVVRGLDPGSQMYLDSQGEPELSGGADPAARVLRRRRAGHGSLLAA